MADVEKWHLYLDDEGNFFYYLRIETVEKEKDNLQAFYNGRDISDAVMSVIQMDKEENRRAVLHFFNNMVVFRYDRSCYVIQFDVGGQPLSPKRIGFDLNGTSLTLK